MTRKSTSTQADPADGLVIMGGLLLGLALGLAWGWVAILAYAGTVLMIVGMAMAFRRGTNPRG